MPKIASLEDLFVDQMKDLYNAEKQLTRALPKMAKASNAPELRQVIERHLEVTKRQAERLEKLFEEMGLPAKGKTCQGMKGLIEEGQELVNEKIDPEVLDAGIIGAAQRVEHYEIAGYGTARTIAETLGNKKAAKLLEQTLNEEKAADEMLTRVAEKINTRAAESAGASESGQRSESKGSRRR